MAASYYSTSSQQILRNWICHTTTLYSVSALRAVPTQKNLHWCVCIMLLKVVQPHTFSLTSQNLFVFLKQHFKCIVVTGDLNVHLDAPTELAAIHASEVFLLTNMRQNVHLSTHRQGHILDVVVSSEYCTITGLSIHRPNISDHGLITFSCQFRTNPRQKGMQWSLSFHLSHTTIVCNWLNYLKTLWTIW